MNKSDSNEQVELTALPDARANGKFIAATVTRPQVILQASALYCPIESFSYLKTYLKTYLKIYLIVEKSKSKNLT